MTPSLLKPYVPIRSSASMVVTPLTLTECLPSPHQVLSVAAHAPVPFGQTATTLGFADDLAACHPHPGREDDGLGHAVVELHTRYQTALSVLMGREHFHAAPPGATPTTRSRRDRKSTRLNSSHSQN